MKAGVKRVLKMDAGEVVLLPSTGTGVRAGSRSWGTRVRLLAVPGVQLSPHPAPGSPGSGTVVGTGGAHDDRLPLPTGAGPGTRNDP